MSFSRNSLLVLALAGCGGGGDPTSPPVPPPPPPPPAATPASVAVAEGDQQTAAAGAAVAVAPAVVVKDAQGRVLSGVAVQFAVTSGGGTADGASATTDAAGVARVGKWTLGTAGDQRLSAQVASLPAVLFQASVLAGTEGYDVSIGPGGGSLEIATAGHPYRGFALTVPSGAFAGTGRWSFRVAANPSLPTLPAGFTVAGPVLEVTTDLGRANELMTLDVPVHRTAGRGVMIAFRDPVRGAIEILPVVSRTDSSVRILTAHLNAGLLLGPAPATAIRATADPTTVGDLFPIDYPIPVPPVAPVIDAAERWPVVENGTYYHPDGHGPAIPMLEATASADGGTPLGSLVKTLGATGLYGEAAPIAILSEVSNLINETTTQVAVQLRVALAALSKPERDAITHEQTAAALATGQHTVTLALIPEGAGDPLYASAVSSTETGVGFYQPAGALIRSISIAPGQGFESALVQTTADALARQVSEVIAMSSFVAPFERIGRILGDLRDHGSRTGQARRDSDRALAERAGIAVPAVDLQAVPGEGYSRVRGTSVSVRSLLSTLKLPVPGIEGILAPFLEATKAPLAGGAGALVKLGDLFAAVSSTPGSKTTVVMSSAGIVGGKTRQLFALVLDLFDDPFSVTPDTTYFDGPEPDVSFEADIPLPPDVYRIRWNWGDGKTTENLGLPDASHHYDVEGDYTIEAKLLDGDGVVLGVDTVYALSGRPYWKITTIADADEFLDVGELGESPTYDLLARVLASPGSGLIAVDRVDSVRTELRLRVLQAAVWDTTDCCPPPTPVAGEVRETLGKSPAEATGVGPWFAGWEMNTWTQSAPGLGSGTMSGRNILGTTVYNVIDAGTQVGPRGALRIEATRNGRTMTGNIIVTLWYLVDDKGVLKIVDHGEDFRLPFTARRLR